MSLVKSKQRVADHGEVLTPAWMVEAMLDLVGAEVERIDARVLEPACGTGNFLVAALRRKLAAAQLRYGRNEFERRHYSLLGLMSLYGVELLPDNAAECREVLLGAFCEALSLNDDDELRAAAAHVLRLNIVQGDALDMKTADGQPIVFAEWASLGKGKFKRRDFKLDVLTQSAAFGAEDSLFADVGRHELFTPVREHPPMRTADLATAEHELLDAA